MARGTDVNNLKQFKINKHWDLYFENNIIIFLDILIEKFIYLTKKMTYLNKSQKVYKVLY